jgi:hypothetical protein
MLVDPSALLSVPEAGVPGPLPRPGIEVEGDDEGTGGDEEEGEEGHTAEEAHASGARGEVATTEEPEGGAAEADDEDD